MKISKIFDFFSGKKGRVVDLEAIRAVYPKNPELIRELVEIYLAEVPPRMALLAQAVPEKDNDKILQLAHLLKGMSGNLSISLLQERFLELEMMAREKNLDGSETLFSEISDLFDRVKIELEELLASDDI